LPAGAPATDPDGAPLHEGIADGPPGGRAAWIAAEDGVRLRAVHWAPPAPRGTVLIFSGRTEYAEKYGRVARDLWRHDYATLTLDWRGQGLSARLRPGRMLGHVAHFADYQQDVAALVVHGLALGLPRPWYLLAHSMGGAIGFRALCEGLPVRAAAFSAPMFGIQMTGTTRSVAWTLTSLGRSVGLGHLLTPGQAALTYVLMAEAEGNALTTDPETWDWLRRQVTEVPDLALGGPTLHWLNEALREGRRLMALPPPPVPALGLLGTDEMIVDPHRIRRRFEDWPGARLVTLPGARHEVLMEAPAIRTVALSEILSLYAAHA
jgi:lysophospholipase